jgi:hypothetical protein
LWTVLGCFVYDAIGASADDADWVEAGDGVDGRQPGIGRDSDSFSAGGCVKVLAEGGLFEKLILAVVLEQFFHAAADCFIAFACPIEEWAA